MANQVFNLSDFRFSSTTEKFSVGCQGMEIHLDLDTIGGSNGGNTILASLDLLQVQCSNIFFYFSEFWNLAAYEASSGPPLIH
jgi:hypothetical protein